MVLTFALLIGGILIGQAQEKKTYINGIDPDFPPFAYIDKEGNPAGFDVEVVNWIAKEMGFEVKHQPTAWDTIIPTLNAKKIDFIASGLSVTAERAQVIAYTMPYYEHKWALVVREDSDLNIVTGLSGGHTVGVQRGTTGANWIEDSLIKNGVDVKMKVYDTFTLAIEDLLNGRIDSAVQDDTMVKQIMEARPGLKEAGTWGTGEERYAYGLRKGDTELLNLLNEGLTKIMSSPKWNELKAKYGI
ncbi:MAG TPA: transporter substrate-binding domain-containing protein [Candidatus Atribacteria bacterium]|nr:transporter substrate-binding domain-containing protein [Candidatus Atribacteria bacterium]